MGIAGRIANVLQARSAAPPDVEPATFNPGVHTIDEVRAYVDAHPDELAAVLAAEQAGRNRVTLTDALGG